jgi:two-component system, LytTR family, response regulator
MHNCLIIDDEPMAHKVIEFYCSRDASLRIIAQAYDAIEAKKVLEEKSIDIIFLDINMPEISGLQFLSQISTNASVILTTAYAEFALDGFEHGVIDYLLKPIPEDRFKIAIAKAKKFLVAENLKKFIRFKINGINTKFLFSDILYFESKGNYVKIVTRNKNYLAISTLAELENSLSISDFIRIHKSFIVNSLFVINAENKDSVQVNEVVLPIGRTYKSTVINFLEQQ